MFGECSNYKTYCCSPSIQYYYFVSVARMYGTIYMQYQILLNRKDAKRKENEDLIVERALNMHKWPNISSECMNCLDTPGSQSKSL